ncbi:MAG: alpha/beta hydrolase [Candidatus Acidiferrales bacterium]
MKRLSQLIATTTITVACGLALGGGTAYAKDKKPAVKSGFVTTSDGVRIHYLEAGRLATTPSAQVGNPMPAGAVIQKGVIGVSTAHQFPSILFVPGWTMPAWIWQKQMDYFSRDYRVVAMDPRCQGESSQTSDGLYPAVRARDIKAVVDQLHLAPVVIVAWSMAVVETLAYVDQFGTGDFAGLVLVDSDAGGRAPGSDEADFATLKELLMNRQKAADEFMRKLNFQKPQPEDYIQKLIQASLRVPTNTAVTLLVGYFTADYRAALPKIDKPTVICAAKSTYMSTIVDMQSKIKGAQLEVFVGDGHALFVDDPDKFNALLEDFLVELK